MWKRFWITLLSLVLSACQGVGTPETPAEMLQTAPPSPLVSVTLSPLPSLTPSPVPPMPSPSLTLTVTPQPSPTLTPPTTSSTPYPEEWLAFVIREFGPSDKPRVFNLFRANTTISFISNEGSELFQPKLIDTDKITIERSLAWSPDGRYLLFDGRSYAKFRQAPTDEGRELPALFHLYLSDLPVGTLTKMEGGFDGTYYGNPSWAPDSRKFANTVETRVTTTEGKTQIFPKLVITSADYPRRWKLTTGSFSDLYPGWSPDGQWIAYLRYTSPGSPCSLVIPTNYGGCNKADLYLIRSDGGEPRLLLGSIYVQTDRDGRDSTYNAPAWSSDSRWLAVLVGEHQPDIALVNIENGETRTLAPHPSQDLYPTWSPDGSRLAFVSNRGGDEDIYLVSIDGTELINLTRNPASDFNPVWSPSERFIAFLSDRGEPGAYKLYVMNADGSDQRKLYDGYVFTRPAWFPRLDVDLRDFIKFGSN